MLVESHENPSPRAPVGDKKDIKFQLLKVKIIASSLIHIKIAVLKCTMLNMCNFDEREVKFPTECLIS